MCTIDNLTQLKLAYRQKHSTTTKLNMEEMSTPHTNEEDGNCEVCVCGGGGDENVWIISLERRPI